MFISVDLLCEFVMVPDVYILLSHQEEKVHSSSWRDRCSHEAAHWSKRVKLLSVIILMRQGNRSKNEKTRLQDNCSVNDPLNVEFWWGYYIVWGKTEARNLNVLSCL